MNTILTTYTETQTIDHNEGKDITGAVVVEWNWEKYPGYCRNLTDIGIAGEGIFYSLKKGRDKRIFKNIRETRLS